MFLMSFFTISYLNYCYAQMRTNIGCCVFSVFIKWKWLNMDMLARRNTKLLEN